MVLSGIVLARPCQEYSTSGSRILGEGARKISADGDILGNDQRVDFPLIPTVISSICRFSDPLEGLCFILMMIIYSSSL